MNFESGAPPPYPIATDCFRPFRSEAICAMFAELFFNHSGTETFRGKLLKMILADKQE
jgi:hypothetical protein